MPQLAQIATARQAQLKDGRRLGFAEYGDRDGAPLILLHDLFGNRALRHPDDSILSRLGIRLIGVDRPGYGQSTRKPGRSLMDVAEDIMLLSRALGLERFSVLGFDAGGPYALACAYRFPELIKRCAVVASLPPMDNPIGFRAVHPFYARLFQLAHGKEGFFRMLLQGLFWLDAQRPPEQFMRDLAASLSPPDQEIMSNIKLLGARRDMWDENRGNGSECMADEMVSLVGSWGFHLQSIRVPVDIWWGEYDNFCAPIVGKRMANMIPNATLRMEAGAGHLLLYSHWQAILSALTGD